MPIPIATRIVSGPSLSEVIVLSEEMSLEEIQVAIYLAFKPNIPQIWQDDYGGEIGKMGDIWVDWTSPNEQFPRMTPLHDGNVSAVLQLLALRRGVDVLGVNLPTPPEQEEPAEEPVEEEEGY
ncbi:hypothetical protein BJY01DRAFT_249060 [Aspergillus pseudoustus]|uniref:Uncharacterized protein n=1 Tax=Aspergillus pseudoustus TaxID=1810923 RepID=A0ABR4JRC8_9EURO